MSLAFAIGILVIIGLLRSITKSINELTIRLDKPQQQSDVRIVLDYEAKVALDSIKHHLMVIEESFSGYKWTDGKRTKVIGSINEKHEETIKKLADIEKTLKEINWNFRYKQ